MTDDQSKELKTDKEVQDSLNEHNPKRDLLLYAKVRQENPQAIIRDLFYTKPASYSLLSGITGGG